MKELLKRIFKILFVNYCYMIKKTVWLWIIFAVGFSFFLASFFDLILLHPLISWFFLYAWMMLWSVSNGPITIRSRHKKWIMGTVLAFTIILVWKTNSYIALSFLILVSWMIFTFRDMNYYKNKVLRFNLRWYCVFWGYAMIYFMWFSIAANIIGKNATLDFNCDDIYRYYQTTSDYFFHKNKKPAIASYPPDFMSRMSENIKTTLIKTPWLLSLYTKIEWYRGELQTTVIDQQQINKEVCMLVFGKIHSVYNSWQVKIGLVFLIWIFLYPFFIILVYIYGLLTLAIFHIFLSLGYFTFVKRKTEKISLE